jgi:hypothetical protein
MIENIDETREQMLPTTPTQRVTPQEQHSTTASTTRIPSATELLTAAQTEWRNFFTRSHNLEAQNIPTREVRISAEN